MIDAFRLRIEHNEWMSEETQAKAIEKLDLLQLSIRGHDGEAGP